MTPQQRRIAALRRFAIGITALTIAGHVFLGFEQSWEQVVVSLTTCYGLELALETVQAWSAHRRPRFLGGGPVGLLDHMLPAHITALAIALLLYPGSRIAPIVLAGVLAVASKALLRAPVGKGSRHVYNPSNFGIAATLLLFPSVSISPPYHFTENIYGVGDWLLPALIIVTGTLLNVQLTGKPPLIVAWLTTFAAQALVRHLVGGEALASALLPMSGMAFILFTFYMVTDPGTTPSRPRAQVAFGAGVAVAYGVLMSLHVVFGLFFALAIVSSVRGLSLHAVAYARARAARRPHEVVLGRPAVAGVARRLP